MNLARHSIVTLITSFSSVCVSFINNVLISRTFGPEGNGKFYLIFTAANILTIVGSIGISNANVYFMGVDKKNHDSVLTNTLLYSLFAIPAVVLIYLQIPHSFLNEIPPELKRNGVFLLCTVFLNTILLSLYHAKKLFNKYNLFIFLRPSILLVSFVILRITGRFTLNNAFAALVLSFAAVIVIQLLLMKSFRPKSLHFNSALLIKSIKYGIKSQLGTFLQLFNYRLDFFLTNLFTNISNVGYYQISTVLSEVILHIPRALSLILLPVLSEKKSEEEIQNLTERSCRIAMFFTFLSGLGLILGSKLFILFFYSGKFANSIVPLMILVPGTVILSISNIISQNLLSRGYPIYSSICTGSGFIVTIILDIILIPRYGILGAAIATTCSYTTTTILYLYYYSRHTSFRLLDILLMKKYDFLYLKDKLSMLLK